MEFSFVLDELYYYDVIVLIFCFFIIQHWEQKNLTDYYCIAFGKEGLTDFSEYQMLFFPVWYQSHFFLLVGYPKREKWEYYNSLDSDDYWKYARHFVSIFLLLKYIYYIF